jgi:hypothetical protein
MLYLNLRVNIATRSICLAQTMTQATLTADISVIKSQLQTEIAKYQSEIYLRQAKIHALDVFGNSDTVQNWLQEQNPALDGATPTDLLNSAAGLERVIDLINRTRTKLERLRQRIELMKQTPVDPDSEADFNKFTGIFDAQRSIDSQYTRRIEIESYDFLDRSLQLILISLQLSDFCHHLLIVFHLPLLAIQLSRLAIVIDCTLFIS